MTPWIAHFLVVMSIIILVFLLIDLFVLAIASTVLNSHQNVIEEGLEKAGLELRLKQPRNARGQFQSPPRETEQ